MSKDSSTYEKGQTSFRSGQSSSAGRSRSTRRHFATMIILGALLLIGVAFILNMLFGEGINWQEVYHKDATSPYGGYVLSEMLRRSRPDSTFYVVDSKITESISIDTIPENSTYVFFGNRHFLDSSESAFIKNFVARGNDAYVICKRQNITLMNDLVDYEIEYWDDLDDNFRLSTSPLKQFRDSVVELQLSPMGEAWDSYSDNDVKITWIIDEIPTEHSWMYFKDGLLNKTGNEVMTVSYVDDGYINCISLNHGEGRLLFHSTPEVFTNYFLRDPDIFNYANELFADLGDGIIIWDEDNRNFQETRGNAEDFGEQGAEEGALSFILGQPRLRAAWYIMLLAVLLYLLFGARRNQRVIPVLRKNTNTSIKYSETVGQIYMQQKDHRSLAILKMKLFLAFIRDHYNLKTSLNSPEEEQRLVTTIAQKSNIKREDVERIFKLKNGISTSTDIQVDALIKLHRHLEYFYNNCK